MFPSAWNKLNFQANGAAAAVPSVSTGSNGDGDVSIQYSQLSHSMCSCNWLRGYDKNYEQLS